MTLNTEIARGLLDIKAVQIKTEGYFTWTSGIKSPIYCDNRMTMTYPDIRKKIVKAFMNKIDQMDVKPDVIAGCATAGIPHAAWLSEELNLPMIYVRSAPKGHGKGNQIEGLLKEGQNVILIEDLISTGGSSIQAAKAILGAGANVIATLAIFTYGLNKSIEQFKKEGIALSTITDFDQLLSVLIEDGKINQKESDELTKWRNNL